MPTVSLDLALQIGGLVLSAAILVLGLKYAINGLSKDVRAIKSEVSAIHTDVKTLMASDADQDKEIGIIGATQEAHDGWIRRLEKWLERLQALVERRSENRGER